MITDTEIRMVSTLADRQVELEYEIENLEELLKSKKEEHRLLSQETLPNAMAEVGMASFTLNNGRKITIKTNYYASIPKGEESTAFDWLRDHGFASLIKNQVVAEFGKGEDGRAKQVVDMLREEGVFPTQKLSVHPQTLKAFVKEQMTEGKELPLDVFGAYVVNESVVV